LSTGTEGFLSNLPEWLVLVALGVAALSALLALICALVALRVRGRVVTTATTLSSLEQKMEEVQASLAQRIDEAQLSLDQKTDEIRASAQSQADEAKSKADQARQFAEQTRNEVTNMVDRVAKFEDYFRNVFEKSLSNTFANFDQTVTDVLGQMRSELERGITRIDQMKSMVENRGQAEERLIESTEEVQNLLSEGQTGAEQPEEPDKSEGASGPAPVEDPAPFDESEEAPPPAS